ncbi:AAA family ATPase, partial [Candidatus Poribacteria bacterium]|nr:AAA family ATPase [Candidatus Poribacteria bacterium]
MSKLLDGLNPSQREAVKHEKGPLLIIAGPGSGKTETVARSIAYAIENLEVGPSQIAAFTFTNKAKDDLKKRISDNIVRQDLVNDIWIRTFHSFCGHVWNKHPRKLVIENERYFTAEELTRVYRAQITHLQYHQFDDKEIFNFIREYEKQDIEQVPQIYVDIYKKYTQIL